MKTIMKKIKRFFFLKYLIFGFLIAFLFHSAGSCKKDSPLKEPPPTENNNNNSVVPINDMVKSVEAAFRTGDMNNIKSVLSEEAWKVYGTDLSQADKKNLVKFGEALNTRVLKVETDLYSEYNFTMDGTVFSISMAKQKDGSWKLMRY